MTERNEPAASSDADLRRVTTEVAGRLRALGIVLTGDEDPEELVQIQEAVERFETVVESRGGDLMMDEPPRGSSGRPDDKHFALPLRSADESSRARPPLHHQRA